jgi:hypothetical protein
MHRDIGWAGRPAQVIDGCVAVERYRADHGFSWASEQVEVCGGNPFDTPVSIRATLDGALSEMSAALEIFAAFGSRRRRDDAGAGGT